MRGSGCQSPGRCLSIVSEGAGRVECMWLVYGVGCGVVRCGAVWCGVVRCGAQFARQGCLECLQERMTLHVIQWFFLSIFLKGVDSSDFYWLVVRICMESWHDLVLPESYRPLSSWVKQLYRGVYFVSLPIIPVTFD